MWYMPYFILKLHVVQRLSLNLNRLTVITMETVEKSLTTGALGGSGVLYSKNSFKTIEFINNDDIS